MLNAVVNRSFLTIISGGSALPTPLLAVHCKQKLSSKVLSVDWPALRLVVRRHVEIGIGGFVSKCAHVCSCRRDEYFALIGYHT